MQKTVMSLFSLSNSLKLFTYSIIRHWDVCVSASSGISLYLHNWHRCTDHLILILFLLYCIFYFLCLTSLLSVPELLIRCTFITDKSTDASLHLSVLYAAIFIACRKNEHMTCFQCRINIHFISIKTRIPSGT